MNAQNIWHCSERRFELRKVRNEKGFCSEILCLCTTTHMHRSCFVLFLCFQVVFAVGSAFADCLSLFAVLRFVVGASVTGLTLSQYVFTLELVGPSKRTMGGKLQDFYWVAAGSITALFAYLIRDWSHLIIACSLPGLLLFLFWRFEFVSQ